MEHGRSFFRAFICSIRSHTVSNDGSIEPYSASIFSAKQSLLSETFDPSTIDSLSNDSKDSSSIDIENAETFSSAFIDGSFPSYCSSFHISFDDKAISNSK